MHNFNNLISGWYSKNLKFINFFSRKFGVKKKKIKKEITFAFCSHISWWRIKAVNGWLEVSKNYFFIFRNSPRLLACQVLQSHLANTNSWCGNRVFIYDLTEDDLHWVTGCLRHYQLYNMNCVWSAAVFLFCFTCRFNGLSQSWTAITFKYPIHFFETTIWS